MFNPWPVLRSLGPRLFAEGTWHRLRTAIAEAKHVQPHVTGLARWQEAWRRADHRERPPQVEWSTLGAVQSFERDERGATVRCENAELRVRVFADGLMQLRVGRAPFAEAHSYGVARAEGEWPAAAFSIDESPQSIAVSTPALSLRIDRASGAIAVTDASGAFCTLRLHAPAAHGTHWSARFEPTVAFHGLGERSHAMNLAGQRFELWNFDPGGYKRGDDPLYLSVPFVVAHSAGRALGLFFDNPFRSWADTGAAHANELAFTAAGGELRLYLMAGSPAHVLERYTALTGRAPLPPRWAFGFHQSRYSYFPDSRVLELAEEFRRRRLPCDVLHLDIDYMDGFRCFTWHPVRFPRPRQLTQKLHALGFKALTIVDPGIKVDRGYRTYDEGLAGGHFVRWPDGEPFTGPVWPGACHFPDFSAARTRAWWGEQYRGLLDDGIDAIWNDMNEIALLTVPPGGVAPDTLVHDADGRGATHAELHNQYGMLMARATQEGLAKLRPERRPVVLTRSGWAGVQRHALHWTGDNESTWDHLKLSLSMVLNLGWSGIALTGPDTGGFGGGPSRELFTRWMQLSSFLPFFRVHSVKASPAQEPWAFGPEVEGICRDVLELRYRLLPYLYTAAWQSSQTGRPIARAMSFDFGADARFASLDDQFMLGDSLLIAPVLNAGMRERTVMLPAGPWFDFETGERYGGSDTVKVRANIERIPVFIRGGAVVPLWPVQQHVGERSIDEVELVCAVAPGERQSVWYDDDGERPNPTEAERCVHRFTLRGDPCELTRASDGGWPGPKRWRLRFYGLDERVVTVERDEWVTFRHRS